MSEPIRILLVDDHPVVREGMRTVLDRFPNLTVVSTAASGELAITACHNVNPDVVLMDMHLPDMTGIEAMARILSQMPDTKILIFSGHSNDMRVGEALDHGAMGYMMKDADIPELVRAIEAAVEGKHTLAPEAVKSLIQSRPKPDASKADLSTRELEILGMIVHGFKNHDIGEQLDISLSTVKTYTARIYKKLEVGSRSEAAAKAISQRIIPSD